MIILSTNMPQLAKQLYQLGMGSLKDTHGQLVLKVPLVVDVQIVDDLICDAVFEDPIERVLDGDGWVIYLTKRDRNRPPADEMLVRQEGVRHEYLLSGQAA